MALVSLDGGFTGLIGPGVFSTDTRPLATTITVDAANEAVIFIGRIKTSDGASHTIDTTGSSSLGWRTGTVTFSNAGTTVKVGLAAVLTTAGPPGRAAHASDVITFDVNAAPVGGSGTITTNAWQTTVPTAGTKTVADGDLVAFCVQMTARGGADTVQVTALGVAAQFNRPIVTSFLSAAYASQAALPNCLITFSDGALGYFYGTEVFSTHATRTWGSGDATKEYGQLYQLPFPAKIYGIYGWTDPDGDMDIVLYSDPLGTPVAEKTVSIDANTVGSANGRRFVELFPSPYTTKAGQLIVAAYKPGATNCSAYYKTLASATHRAADVWGTNGYGVSRAAAAFSNANSSLDHYYIGLIVGAFEHGVSPTYVLGI